jgi:hypothetical protein
MVDFAGVVSNSKVLRSRPCDCCLIFKLQTKCRHARHNSELPNAAQVTTTMKIDGGAFDF